MHKRKLEAIEILERNNTQNLKKKIKRWKQAKKLLSRIFWASKRAVTAKIKYYKMPKNKASYTLIFISSFYLNLDVD